MKITKGKIVDGLSFLLALVGIIYSILALIAGITTPEQTIVIASVSATVSQAGSMIRIILDNLQSLPDFTLGDDETVPEEPPE